MHAGSSEDLGSSLDKATLDDSKPSSDLGRSSVSGDLEDDLLPSRQSEGSVSDANDLASTADSEERRAAKRLHKATPRQQLAYAMRISEMTDMETFWDPVLDTKAILAWNRRQVVLSFRGTSSLKNALSDIKIWRTDHPVIGEMTHLGLKPRVHSGFYKAWTAKGLNTQVVSHMQVRVSRIHLQR